MIPPLPPLRGGTAAVSIRSSWGAQLLGLRAPDPRFLFVRTKRNQKVA